MYSDLMNNWSAHYRDTDEIEAHLNEVAHDLANEGLGPRSDHEANRTTRRAVMAVEIGGFLVREAERLTNGEPELMEAVGKVFADFLAVVEAGGMR
jgi:hypothetical protein